MRSVRIVTINLWNTARNPDARLEVLIPQLIALQPQIVALQEVRDVTGGRHQAEVIAKALRGEYRYAAADPKSEGGPIGNAVVSRLPIISHEVIALPAPRADDLRNAIRCEIQTPHGRLPFISTHLTWELDAAPVREEQVVLLDEWARKNPGGIPSVMCGDFNCTPDGLVHQFLTGRSSLLGRGTYWRDAYQRRHPHSDGFTWSARNPYVARSIERNRRLDYVFVGPMHDQGPGGILHARVCLDLASGEDVFPSDHFGVFVELSLVPVDRGV
jgi:endonuclease/exonuclease/phosphatase family metal-dependent hydrolase